MRSRKTLLLPPTIDPVSLSEVKGYLRIDAADEDNLLRDLMAAAVRKFEEYLDFGIMYQEWAVYFDGFGMTRNPAFDNYNSWDTGYVPNLFMGCNYLELPIGNIIDIKEFNTYDDSDIAYPFASSNFNVDKISTPARIMLKRGQVWPTTYLRTVNGIEIKVRVGWITSDEVPAPIKQAIKLYVAQMYESRGDDSLDENRFSIPKQALALLDQYKLYRV